MRIYETVENLSDYGTMDIRYLGEECLECVGGYGDDGGEIE